jgi:hypothetical protein
MAATHRAATAGDDSPAAVVYHPRASTGAARPGSSLSWESQKIHESVRRSATAIGALLAGTTLVVACGSTASPNPSAAVSAAASVAASVASVAPSGAASPSAAASGGASAGPSIAFPSGFNQAPELEKQIPDQVGGETLSKLSFKGDTALTGGGNSSAQLQALLGALGKSASDISFAVGAGTGITVGVYQINGVDANTLMGVLGQAVQQGQAGSSISDATKGGKSVKVLTGGSASTSVYFYAHGDLLFFVSGDDAKATEALTKLP